MRQVAGRWTAWARQLRERHALRLGRPQSLPMVLASGGARTIVMQRRGAWRVALRVLPRFSFTVLRGGAPRPVFVTRAGTAIPHPGQVTREVVSTAAVQPGQSRMIERTIERRWSALPGKAGQAPPAGPSTAEAIDRRTRTLEETVLNRYRAVAIAGQVREPIARLRQRMHRNESPSAEPPRVVVRPQNEQPAFSRQEPAAAPQVPPPAAPWMDPRVPPPVNIDMLADQVISQIDRRVIAHRERMGRI